MITTEQKKSARPLPIFKPKLRQAIRENRKVQTRRIVNPQPPTSEQVKAICGADYHWFNDEQSKPGHFRVAGPVWAVRKLMMEDLESDLPACLTLKSPYGKAGDIAYLREPLWKDDRIDYQKGVRNAVIYQDEPEWCINHDGIECRVSCPDGYLPTRDEAAADIQSNPHWSTGAWTSMTMPKWAARTFVRITDIRVEQLQTINSMGAIKEGLPIADLERGWQHHKDNQRWTSSAKVAFMWLWDSIHGQESWKQNPWVWVIEWEQV